MTPDLPWKGLSIDGTGAPPPELDRTGAVALVPAGDRAWAAGAAVTLARSLARGGRRVYLCDLDLVAPRLHDMVGVGRRSGASDFAVYGASSGHVTIQLEERLLFVSAGTPVVDQEGVYASRRWESLFEAAVHSRAVVLLFLPADLRGAHALLDRVGTLVALGHPGELPDLGDARENLRLGFQPLSAPLPTRRPPVPVPAEDDEPTDVDELLPDIDLLAPDVAPAPPSGVVGPPDEVVDVAETADAAGDVGASDSEEAGEATETVAAATWDSDGEPRVEESPTEEPVVGDSGDDGWDDPEWGAVGSTTSGSPVAEPLDEAASEPGDAPGDEAAPAAAAEEEWPAAEPASAPGAESPTEQEPEPAPEPAASPGSTEAPGGRAPYEWDESEVRERWSGPEERRGRWGFWLILLAVVVAALFAAARMGWIDLPGVASRRADPGQDRPATETAAPAAAEVPDEGEGEVAARPGPDEGAPATETAGAPAVDAAAGPETAPPAPAPLSDAAVTAPLQEWSLRIGAYSSQAVARREAANLSSRVPDHVIVVAPVEVQGRRWWRVISSLAVDQASAEGLRTELAAAVADAEPGQWLVRRASRAFVLDETGTEAEARARAAEWRGRGIDAYVLAVPRAGGSRTYRVYAGAYEDGTEASVLRGLLAEAGVPSPSLVERRGILPE